MIFIKMAGTGNDFILIDHIFRKGRGRSPVRLSRGFIKRLTHRQNGVGADGVLLLEKPDPSGGVDFRMRIFNPDGSQAQMCGNGIRCAAYYAYRHRIAPARMKIETLTGVLKAEIKGKNRVRVQLPAPKAWRNGLNFRYDGFSLKGGFVNTGVPHAVFFTDDLNEVNVEKTGRFIRRHKSFAPEGTNVNFVRRLGSHQIQVRTYERGVEGETLACGTGAAASALIAVRLGVIRPPVTVLTKSRERLRIDFQENAGVIENVWLEGPVRILFRGVTENV